MFMKIIVNELEKSQGQRQLLDGPIRIDEIDMDPLSFDQFEFTGEARKEADLVRVHGEITGLIKTGCSRCAVPTTYRFVAPFAEQFSDTVENDDEDEEEIIPYT